MNILSGLVSKAIAYAEREPVRTLGILRSLAMVFAAFLPGVFSPEQAQAIDGLAVVLLGVDQAIRSQVTPA